MRCANEILGPACRRDGSARPTARSRRSASAPGRSAAAGVRPTTSESLAAMHAAVDAGVTFFDTADVYGDGRSERLIAQLLRERPRAARRRDEVRPARTARRRGSYTYDNLRAWLERSRENLGVDVVDLVQLHCPPWEAYYAPAVFEACDRLVEDGLVRALRRQRREGRGGAEGDRVPGRRDRADHLQHLPPAPGRALLRAGAAARRRRHRPRAARLRAAGREVHARHAVRGRRPSRASTGTASGSTSARRSPGVDFERGLDAVDELARSSPRARRSRSSRCAGSSASTPSRRSSPARRRWSRRGRTRPRPQLPPLPTTRPCSRSTSCTGRESRREVHHRW